jgi:NAD(P)-dependent dehydrogenase (short-subunit alcohol dehydrogenase family)
VSASATRIAAAGAKGKVEVAALDLADLKSVRAFAESFLKSHDVLHGLVNNAGVMNTATGKTKDGFEVQLGTNHLGHYLLTELLLGALERGAPSRVVILSSCYHDVAQGREGHIDFDDLHFERRPYDGWAAYAQSKLANLLHARSLAARVGAKGITAVSVHPGWVRTNLIRGSMPVWAQDYVLRPFLHLAGMIEPWEGAQTTLYALLAPDVTSHPGAYYSQLGMYRERRFNKGGWPMESPNPEAARRRRRRAPRRRLAQARGPRRRQLTPRAGGDGPRKRRWRTAALRPPSPCGRRLTAW